MIVARDAVATGTGGVGRDRRLVRPTAVMGRSGCVHAGVQTGAFRR